MINHAGHPHPATPKARALCRANGGTGSIAKKGADVPKTKSTGAAPKKKPRVIQDIGTGKPISREAAAAIMFGKPVAKPTAKKPPAKKRVPGLAETRIPVAKVTSTSKTMGLRSDPQYVKDYNRGFRAAAKTYDLTAADRRGESDAYYDGFSDRSIGAPKWTRTEERDALSTSIAGNKSKPVRSRVPSNDDITKSYLSGIDESKTEELSGGAIAETEKVTFYDGKVGVRKAVAPIDPEILESIYEDNPNLRQWLHDPEMQADAEELAPLLGRMMGLDAPQVRRIDKDTIVMEHFDGVVAADFEGDQEQDFKTHPQASMIALFDQLIGNVDRNEGNWMIGDDNRIKLIDHGMSWSREINGRPVGKPTNTGGIFAEGFVKREGRQVVGFQDNDIHPDDIRAVSDMLNELKPEFDKRNRADWWGYSVLQLKAIEPHAKGTTRRLS